MKIKLKRVYDPPSEEDGIRVLVERLWPRGVKKTELKIDAWLKEAAPSTDLRKWFSHDPAKWNEFQKKYHAELKGNPNAWEPIVDAWKKGPVTLIFSSRDTEHNNAVSLKAFLEKELK